MTPTMATKEFFVGGFSNRQKYNYHSEMDPDRDKVTIEASFSIFTMPGEIVGGRMSHYRKKEQHTVIRERHFMRRTFSDWSQLPCLSIYSAIFFKVRVFVLLA